MDAATQRRIMEQVEATRRANPFYLPAAITNLGETRQRITRLERMILVIARELRAHDDPESPSADLRDIIRALEDEKMT